jgi:hypothetical protein
MRSLDAITEWRTIEPQGGWMSFRKDNREYEAWLATQCDILKKDIKEKHRQMKKSAFIFLRATYFRWATKIPTPCPELMDAPQVLSVGDLHLENFGTWRDADGSVRVNVLQAMGFDLGSIHAAGSPGVRALRADLKKRPHGWLNAAAKTAVAAVKRDHEEWRG